MTNLAEEARTVCVCNDTQHFVPDGSHRTVPTGGVSNEPNDEPRWLNMDRVPYHGGGVMARQRR
jgi:hypothetical protein